MSIAKTNHVWTAKFEISKTSVDTSHHAPFLLVENPGGYLILNLSFQFNPTCINNYISPMQIAVAIEGKCCPNGSISRGEIIALSLRFLLSTVDRS